MVSLQSIIWVFLLNNFSRVINLLLTKLARDRTGRISALGLFCTDLAALGPYCQDLGPIFSQYGPRAWLIRYMNYPRDMSYKDWLFKLSLLPIENPREMKDLVSIYNARASQIDLGHQDFFVKL